MSMSDVLKKLISIVIIGAFFLAACFNSGSSTSTGGGATSALSDAEVETLVYMREEEKLARDVYRMLFTRWNLQIFNNIAGSEQVHMDTLAAMLATYDAADPVASDSTASFTNPVLASLYDQLVVQGSISVSETIQVGIFIEETDITDLQKAISESMHDDLDRAHENLLQGSYNHLQAFITQPS